MSDKPLSVAVAVVIHNDKILLINRKRGEFVKLLALPGGKIEFHEHASEAAVREIEEESGIKSVFKKHLAVISEHVMVDGEIEKSFIIHLIQLEPLTTEILTDNEGKLNWFVLGMLDSIENKIIPSDFQMIKRIVMNKEDNYFNCVMEKTGNDYVLKKFE